MFTYRHFSTAPELVLESGSGTYLFNRLSLVPLGQPLAEIANLSQAEIANMDAYNWRRFKGEDGHPGQAFIDRLRACLHPLAFKYITFEHDARQYNPGSWGQSHGRHAWIFPDFHVDPRDGEQEDYYLDELRFIACSGEPLTRFLTRRNIRCSYDYLNDPAQFTPTLREQAGLKAFLPGQIVAFRGGTELHSVWFNPTSQTLWRYAISASVRPAGDFFVDVDTWEAAILRYHAGLLEQTTYMQGGGTHRALVPMLDLTGVAPRIFQTIADIVENGI